MSYRLPTLAMYRAVRGQHACHVVERRETTAALGTDHPRVYVPFESKSARQVEGAIP